MGIRQSIRRFLNPTEPHVELESRHERREEAREREKGEPGPFWKDSDRHDNPQGDPYPEGWWDGRVSEPENRAGRRQDEHDHPTKSSD